MKPSSNPKLHSTMEWKATQNKIGSFLLWSLVLSTILLLLILNSSSPFIIVTSPKEVLNQTSPQLENSNQTIPLAITPVDDEVHSQNPSDKLQGQEIHNQSHISSDKFQQQEIHNQSHTSSERIMSHTSSDGIMLPQFPNPSNATEGREEMCDLFAGKWVREPRGSVYTNLTCPTLPELKNCGKYGKDQGYVYWRWKPDGCKLARFDPGMFLSIVRGKKLAFIGDSLARNQMESLLCLLSQAETPIDMYKDANDKFRTWYFPSHDFTLMVMWAEFLVVGEERIINGTGSNAFNVHLDRINKEWAKKLSGLNYAVISGGNWLFRKNYMYEGGKLIGCVNCKEGNLTNFGVAFAVRRVFKTALKYISKCKECESLVTLLRTYSPAHFENGSWFTGGYCNRTEPLSDSDVRLEGITWELRNIQLEEMRRVKKKYGKGKKKFEVMDVTKAMMLRADGHPGSFWNRKWLRSTNDCLHWCLPGPVDMWNDLLLATIKRNAMLY